MTTLFLNSAYEGLHAAFDAARAAGRIAVVEEENLAVRDPKAARGLIVTSHVDQVWLPTQKSWLDAFLDAGGRLAFNGHVESDFLDGLMPYRALKNRNFAAFEVARIADHPIWRGYDGRALTYRKGVSGFYGRGENPPPSGAAIVNILDAGGERLAVDWDWERPGGGRVLSHAGNDLWNTFEHTADNAALVGRLLDWLEAA